MSEKIRRARQPIDNACRAGISQFQVLTLVHRQDLLLIDHRGHDIFAVPITWVRPRESIRHVAAEAPASERNDHRGQR
jgi:hypothetical protein